MKVKTALVCIGLMSPATSYGFKYVAMGDSISSGTNAETQSIRSDFSWTEGASLERNFVQALGTGLEHHVNASVPGAMAPLLHVQAYAVEWMQPRYVSITIGGNDFAWGQGHELLPNLRAVLGRLSAHDYIDRIFLATIPDLEQIYQIGNNDAHCRSLHIMAPFFLMASDERRRDIANQIHTANKQIKELVTEFPKLVVVDAVSDRTYEADDISHVDCIHPSRKGQQQIADAFIKALRAVEAD